MISVTLARRTIMGAPYRAIYHGHFRLWVIIRKSNGLVVGVGRTI